MPSLVGLLSFDDTDSVRGGCTTHLALQILEAIPDVDLVGYPRLVRLNPNVPWKTRGNGAVALPLGHGRGPSRIAGETPNGPLRAFERAEDLDRREATRVFETAKRLIATQARLEDPNTNPALAYFFQPPPAANYWNAVRRVVDRTEVEPNLAPDLALWGAWKNGRGVIGATAAAAWPARHGTYEWIAYRQESRWGTTRTLDPAIGPALDQRHPTTFDNYDPTNDHLRIEPRSPCPVLAGIRGTSASDLVESRRLLGPEPSAGGLLFATNQATDDHLRPLAVAQLAPFQGARVTGTIEGAPRITPGGHVFVRLTDGTGRVTLAAYEPTKGLRRAVRALRSGDTVEASGSVHADPGLLALEKLQVLAAPPRVRTRPPLCDPCGVRMKSRGKGETYRCKRCHARRPAAEREIAYEEPPQILGYHEVPVHVRRHLARPLRFNAPPAMGWC